MRFLIEFDHVAYPAIVVPPFLDDTRIRINGEFRETDSPTVRQSQKITKAEYIAQLNGSVRRDVAAVDAEFVAKESVSGRVNPLDPIQIEGEFLGRIIFEARLGASYGVTAGY